MRYVQNYYGLGTVIYRLNYGLVMLCRLLQNIRFGGKILLVLIGLLMSIGLIQM
jgi:hypothetical protein